MNTSAELIEIIHQWMDTFIHRGMRAFSRYAKANGLSMPQFSILMMLHHHGNFGLSAISERMDVSNAAASQLVERLVQSGLIERTEDPDDRRAKRIAITEKGRALIEEGIAERYRWLEAVVNGLPDEQRQAVGEALAALTEAARQLD